ncbi:hypothetical protein GCM10008927_22950 [Amylibacter ulvae]|uniref:TIGR02302 family protein n=1 Tax=Paramylibacter ulvae TaxID=1651968 RepID=A0ABQ3D7C8_9RHOB|nr:DUF4175 family protein [Amylibacter ulvae]GHA56568.1 hypothetical protein GCM10008927_22950 [Amylibacter ulvae]
MDTDDQTAQEIATRAVKKLRRKIAISRGVLACERFIASFWPVAILFLLAFTLMYLGVFSILPTYVFLALCLIVAIVLVVFIRNPKRKFAWPSEQAAINRLDIGLNGRPIAGLHDRIALGQGDPAAEYLWALNLQRLADRAKTATISVPEIRLAGQDKWATRLVVLLLFAVSILFVRGDAGRNLLGGIVPSAQSIASGPSFEAWAEPPSYTGLPTIYLNDVPQDTTLKLPQDSQITLRIYGFDGRATLRETISENINAPLPEEPQDVLEHTLIVKSSGTFEVATKLFEDRTWQIEMTPDRAPKIAFGEDISRSIQGEMEIPFVATDDYGVTGGTLSVSLNLDAIDRKYGLAREPEAQTPLEIEIPMPFAADLTNVDDILVDNQAKHPWASLPSILQLRATDTIGNVGQSDVLETNLPGKRFFDTLAAGIVDVRRELLWNRENIDRAVYVIKAITHRPDGLFPDEKAYLMVRTALRRMEYNHETMNDEALAEVTDLLWNAALLIEDGDLDDAKDRLRRAQERLQEAMENGATDEEIEELMQELRDATENYLAQLERRQGDEQQQSNNQGETISQDQIQQMMDEIQELMEQGRMEEAQALMEQLQKLLEEMRYVEMQPGSGGENSEDLQQTLRDQQELADDTFQELQEEFDRQRQQQNGQDDQQGQPQQGNQQGQQGQQQGGQQGQQQGQGEQQGQQQGQGQQGNQQGQQQGQNGGSQNDQRGGQGDSGLAERQEALRRMLRGQRGGVPNDGSEAGQAARDALEQAEREMDRARENLENGDVAGALDNQSDAMDSMREGMRQMNEQSRQAQQGQQQGGEGQAEGEGQGQNPNGRATALDPLGRSQGGMFNDTLTPNGLGEENAKRQNEVLDEIKRRSNERTRPELELDYLKRLLDRF